MRKININKILSALIIIIVALAITIKDVAAFAVGESFTNFGSRDGGLNPSITLKTSSGSYGYGDTIYTADYNNQKYDIFCMDPGLKTPSSLYISRLFLSQSGIEAKDFGLATIITTESSDGGFKTSGDKFVVAKGIALRVFLDGYAKWSNSNSNSIAIAALGTLATAWKGATDTSSTISGEQNVLLDARLLYQMGVQAAESYSSAKNLEIKTEVIEVADVGNINLPTEDEENEDNSNKFAFGGNKTGQESSSENNGPVTKEINKKMIVKVSLSNFDVSQGSFKFDGFSSGSGDVTTTIKGISTENSTDFDTYTTPISYGTNVFDTFSSSVKDNGNGTKSLDLYIAVETTGTVEFNISTEGATEEVCEDACKEANGKITYTYSDPKVLTGAVLYASNATTTTGYQKFLVASKTQEENSEAIEIPVKACANDCKKPPEPCKPVLCEGDECEPDSTLPQICTDDAEVDRKTNTVEYKFIEAYTEDGYNIVKCLFDTEKDIAENSYILNDEDNAKAVSYRSESDRNPYCKILCKEDYSIRVPYKQVTDEGRYFKITLSLKGQQDCYSSKFDEEQFNKDIIAKEKEIIDAINIWNIYYELVNKDTSTLVYSDDNYESCDRAKCSPSINAKSGCSKESTESSPGSEIEQWFVRKGKMTWGGASSPVPYYTIDTSTGAVSTTNSIPDLPDDVIVDYGYINSQTYSSAKCKFSDTNTKKSITTSYSDGTTLTDSVGFGSVDGVSLELKRSGSSLYWQLDNSDSDEKISTTRFIVRGYDSSNKLLFQKRLQVSAPKETKKEGYISTGSSSFTKITILGYDEDERYTNISCSAEQEYCPKTEAPEHFEEMRPQYKNSLDAAKQEVETKVEELKQIIDQYNSCVGDKEYTALSEGYNGSAFWKMIYKYDPEIKYSYDEPDPTDQSRDKWIEEVKNLDCGDGKCDVMFATNEQISAEDCVEEGNVTCNELGASGTFKSVFYESINGSADGADDAYVNTYCIGGVNDDYSCTNETLHTLGSSTYENKPFFICNFSGDKFTCAEEEHPLTKVNYVHKAAIASGDYNTRNVYYTGHHSGDIKIRYTEQPIMNYSQVDGLPVSADTPQNTYIYILNIKNIGTFYNSGELGRIYGPDSRSLSSYVRNLQDSPTATYPITSGVGSDASDTIQKEIQANEYACTYTVSQSSCEDKDGNIHTIDECDFGGAHANWAECQKDICDKSTDSNTYCVKEAESYYICNGTAYDEGSCRAVGSREEGLTADYNYNCCPDCEVVCVGKCLYIIKKNKENDGTLQYDFRTVSPQNMNPNSRKLGYNWDSSNPANSLAAQKATNTIAEIEARAGAGDNMNINISEIAEYTLKVTMTPDMVTWIKEYNNDQATQGAYNNNSLTCYSYDLDGYDEKTCKSSGFTWQEGGCVMSNVFCYSSFIDDLEAQYPQQVDAPHRSEAKNSAYDNFRTYTGITNQGQTIITNDYWTIYKYNNLDINGDGLPDIGPSWK